MNILRFVSCEVLSFETVSQEQERLLKALKPGFEGLCLDLSQVSRCDSAGLALCIEAKRICSHANMIFKLEGLSDTILALATCCGVAPILGLTVPQESI